MSNYDKEVKEAWERWNAEPIDAQPTADVDYERGFIEGYTKAESDIFHGGKYAPVKHGHWIVLHGVLAGDDIYGDMGECSNCGLHLRNWEWDYCPNCGAKMDKEDSEK